MSHPRRAAQLVLALVVTLVACWGGLRLRPRVVELRAAWAEAEQLAAAPGATRAEVDELERQLAREREAGRAAGAALSRSDLSRLAAEAGLAVDVSGLWEPPAAARVLPAGAVAPLAERLHAQQPDRLLVRWSARGEFGALLRFLDGLAATGHAAVLELALARPAGPGLLQIDLVLAP